MRGLWAALLAAVLASHAGAAASDGSAPPAPIAARRVMPAAYYGMAEAPRAESLLRQVMLEAHNDERASLDLSPLRWNEELARDAARYADEMARTGLFRHSSRGSRAIASGENLWMGPRRLYGYDVMVGSFLAEKALFRPTAKLPHFSTTGRWQDVGHYTQMIWRDTRDVGCAVGDGADFEYLVCRYYPAGNAFGQGPLDGMDAPVAIASAEGMRP